MTSFLETEFTLVRKVKFSFKDFSRKHAVHCSSLQLSAGFLEKSIEEKLTFRTVQCRQVKLRSGSEQNPSISLI